MPFIANRNSKKTCRRKGDDTLLGNPKPQSPENLSPRKFWRPWSDEVPYRSLRLQKRDFRFQGLPRTYSILQPKSGDCCGLSTWNLTSYKIWCPCQGRTCEKKNLVQQTIASRWWCVVTVRSLQTISRYAALWFWDLVCSAAVRSLHVLGRSPVCRSFC